MEVCKVTVLVYTTCTTTTTTPITAAAAATSTTTIYLVKIGRPMWEEFSTGASDSACLLFGALYIRGSISKGISGKIFETLNAKTYLAVD